MRAGIRFLIVVFAVAGVLVAGCGDRREESFDQDDFVPLYIRGTDGGGARMGVHRMARYRFLLVPTGLGLTGGLYRGYERDGACRIAVFDVVHLRTAASGFDPRQNVIVVTSPPRTRVQLRVGAGLHASQLELSTQPQCAELDSAGRVLGRWRARRITGRAPRERCGVIARHDHW